MAETMQQEYLAPLVSICMANSININTFSHAYFTINFNIGISLYISDVSSWGDVSTRGDVSSLDDVSSRADMSSLGDVT